MVVSAISDLNLFNALIIIGVAIPTMYMGAKITIRPLKILYFLLPTFLALHGLYHLFSFIADYSGSMLFGFLGDNIVEPVSYVVFFAFVVYFARRGA